MLFFVMQTLIADKQDILLYDVSVMSIMSTIRISSSSVSRLLQFYICPPSFSHRFTMYCCFLSNMLAKVPCEAIEGFSELRESASWNGVLNGGKDFFINQPETSECLLPS